MKPAYQLEPDLTVEEFVDLLRRSTLAERRPVDRPEVIRGMLAHADLIVTATAAGETDTTTFEVPAAQGFPLTFVLSFPSEL